MLPGSTLTTLPSVIIAASVGMAGEWVGVGLRFVSNQTRVHSLTENERLIQQFRLTFDLPAAVHAHGPRE